MTKRYNNRDVSNDSVLNLLKRIWSLLKKRRKIQFVLLIFLMLFSSIAEIVSIGAILPFLSAINNPKYLYQKSFMAYPIKLLGINEPYDLILPLLIFFIFATLFSTILRTLFLWATTKYCFNSGAELSGEMYNKTLYQSYTIHVNRNSSEVINSITFKTDRFIYGVTLPTITLISSFVLLFSILLVIILTVPLSVKILFFTFGLIYLLIVLFSRKKLESNSFIIGKEASRAIKILQEGLGGIRDVLLDGLQKTYTNAFTKADTNLRKAQGNNQLISQMPKIFIESLGLIIIAVVAYSLSIKGSNFSDTIPILGLIALSSQRLLPIFQQTYSSWTSIIGSKDSLIGIVQLLEQNIYIPKNSKVIKFNSQIELRDISYKFLNESKFVLNNINLIIKKGDKIGVIGSTGSGKSTLLDIVMGLLEPTNGQILIDGVKIDRDNTLSWQSNLSHVPQSIFLSDASILENIAFGVEKNNIDIKKAKYAIVQAQLETFIESLPENYDTIIGERGVRLSGGQRQRIGIARSLYKQSNIIIFDEATSALDSKTEEATMEAINALDKNLTLILIAHRISTLKNCNTIIEIKNGTIFRTGKYNEIINE